MVGVECDKDRPMSDKEQSSDSMVLMVAGRDRSGDLRRDVCAEEMALVDPALRERMADGGRVLALRESVTENDFIDCQLEVLGVRTQLDLGECELPESSSVVGRVVGAVRGFVWKLLRFAFEWMLFHQNVINEQQAITLAHEVRLRKRENEDLRKRLDALESKLISSLTGES